MKFQATLEYDPKGRTNGKPWWLIANADEGLRLFLAWLITRERLEYCQQPAWGTHISIIRGEEPKDKGLWKEHNGKIVTFDYDPTQLYTNGTYWWLSVKCDEVLDIRESLGLPRMPKYDLHLTIGNIYKRGILYNNWVNIGE